MFYSRIQIFCLTFSFSVNMLITTKYIRRFFIMKKVLLAIMSASLFLLALSCASLPTEEYNRAQKLREKVIEYNLGEYASETYQKAEKYYNEGEDYYTNEEKKDAKAALDVAISNLNETIKIAFPKYTKALRETTSKNKTSAEEIKAEVAMKESYNKAMSVYAEAQSAEKKGKYEVAVDLYKKAKEQFETLYKKVKELRDRSGAAISEVEEGLSTVEEDAGQVDNIINESQAASEE